MLFALLFIWIQPVHAADFDMMKRDSFLQQVKQEGLKTFCSEKGMNRCYKIDQDECKATFESGFAFCQKIVKVPEEVSLLGEDEVIEGKLGECIGAEYGKNHFKKFRKGSECAIRK